MTNYLTFASAEPFTIAVNNATKNWDGILYYSTDTATWNEWDGTTAIESAEHGGEQRIYMRGSGNSKISELKKNGFGQHIAYKNWVLTGNNIRCNGNIENLLDYETVANGGHPNMAESCFYGMFFDWSGLITAPALPATTLAYGCYKAMFCNCTGLSTAPELPATVLANSCYEEMFMKSGLTTAPALPATTLAEDCYTWMFAYCSGLITVPALPATELPIGCYIRMFYACSGLKFSETQSDECPNEYRIPISGIGVPGEYEVHPMAWMFQGVDGFSSDGTPSINTTYYTANKVIPATQTVTPKHDPAALLMGWQTGEWITRKRG